MKRDRQPDNTRVGLRAQDIQTSTQDVELGPLSGEIKNVRLVGMAERLASHVRGTEVIADYKRLAYVGSQFGIDALVLPQVLKVLEDLEWVRVEKRGASIVKVEESVPYFDDIYSAGGRYFRDSAPTEVEQAAIEVSDILTSSPVPEIYVREQLGLDDTTYAKVLDVGRSGKLIEQYTSPADNETILYSPLYWIENPEKVKRMYELLKRHGADEVHTALSKVRSYQGFPLLNEVLTTESSSSSAEIEIISEAIRRGIILAPEVDSFRGKRNFAFVPTVGLPVEEKIILEKAMAVLACIRYGQHFGSITKIHDPEAILNAVLRPPHRIGSHTEIRRQYAILVGRGMGRVFPDSTQRERYFFELIPTDENKRAVQLARDLLKVGEVIEGKGLSREAQGVLFYTGSYDEAIRTLPKLKKSPQLSLRTQEDLFRVLNDTMDQLRGAL